jgi:predicted metal-dependent enzyme (double-stranded beta helix superfamily)
MFDVDDLIDRCRRARAESEPRRAMREVLEEVLARPAEVAEVLRPSEGGLTLLHRSDELTVVDVVWAPGMEIYPHDHRMWAAIGIYTGGEDNSFFRRSDGSLADSGGKSLRPGDVVLLGDDTIHAVTNPTSQLTGSIHIYGGDFFATERSEWRGDPLREQPYDVQGTLDTFEAANRDLAT